MCIIVKDQSQIFNREISKHWLEYQENIRLTKGRVKTDYIWEASIVETCLQMMIELS